MELDKMGEKRRTHYCGGLSEKDIGRRVTVAGFAQRRRDLGGLIFIDLRDRTGILQLAFDDKTEKSVFEKAFSVRSEFVLMAEGVIRARSSINEELPTGRIELETDSLLILGRAETAPFEILDDTAAKEELRLRYRYLDLRRPSLQKNIMLRHKIAKSARDFFNENGFIEIETPTLIKSTPEGARDYLVPSRVKPGSFFALPQSPQIYKQLLMVAGFDRYFQLARCYRDEDLRADRQPEFTQIDLEMSFVDVEDVIKIGEGFIRRVFSDVLGVTIGEIQRLTYNEAMDRFGSDKPDARFGFELRDISDIAENCGFGVFLGCVASGGTVRAINVKGGAEKLTRREIDKLTEEARGLGAKGLAFARLTKDGTSSSFAKFLTEDEFSAILSRMDAKEGDVLLIVADKKKIALGVLGAIRLSAARLLGAVEEGYKLLWITDFPFFEYNEETGGYDAMHHPFTAPLDECVGCLESEPENVYAKAYDLVLNGVELSSGSIRITDPALQERMFAALGLSEEEAKQKFGFLTDAFRYGAPPHGGMAIGLDRLCMTMLGCDSIRDVTAFPKVATSGELLSGAPSPVDEKQLRELHISTLPEEE